WGCTRRSVPPEQRPRAERAASRPRPWSAPPATEGARFHRTPRRGRSRRALRRAGTNGRSLHGRLVLFLLRGLGVEEAERRRDERRVEDHLLRLERRRAELDVVDVDD